MNVENITVQKRKKRGETTKNEAIAIIIDLIIGHTATATDVFWAFLTKCYEGGWIPHWIGNQIHRLNMGLIIRVLRYLNKYIKKRSI